MAPLPEVAIFHHLLRRQSPGSSVTGDWRQTATPEDLVVESWSQGFLVGAMIIMECVVIANMRRKVLLHKMILLEQLLAMMQGTFCFMDFRGYGWYLSATAALLYLSWIVHNTVAFMKVRPFFRSPGGFFGPRISFWVTRVYWISLAATVPAICFEISNNFRFFNNRGGWYRQVRPWEPLMRDPWWIFTCLILFHVIRRCYGTGILELIVRSPRFGILLLSVFLAIAFTVMDIIASIDVHFTGSADGINPWWKLALVFKTLTDTIMLDDFKSELKRLGAKRIKKEEERRGSITLVVDPRAYRRSSYLDPTDSERTRTDRDGSFGTSAEMDSAGVTRDQADSTYEKKRRRTTISLPRLSRRRIFRRRFTFSKRSTRARKRDTENQYQEEASNEKDQHMREASDGTLAGDGQDRFSAKDDDEDTGDRFAYEELEFATSHPMVNNSHKEEESESEGLEFTTVHPIADTGRRESQDYSPTRVSNIRQPSISVSSRQPSTARTNNMNEFRFSHDESAYDHSTPDGQMSLHDILESGPDESPQPKPKPKSRSKSRNWSRSNGSRSTNNDRRNTRLGSTASYIAGGPAQQARTASTADTNRSDTDRIFDRYMSEMEQESEREAVKQAARERT